MRAFLILLSCFYVLSLSAQETEENFSVPLSKSIKVDGNIQDWKSIPHLSKKFCLDLKPPYTDVQSLKVAMDKENLYLLLNVKNHFGSIKDEAFLKIVIDYDNNKNTGSDDNLRLNKYVPVPGFERVITFKLNKKAVPYYTVLDISKGAKPIANYSADSIMTTTKGNYMEIRIPFKDIIKEDTTISRIIFSEVGTDRDWKQKKAYYVRNLDFSNRLKEEVLSVEEEIALKEKMDSKFSVGWIILLGFGLWLVGPAIAICKKAGIASSNAYLCLIPIFGPFIFAWMLSFSDWKLHKLFYAEVEEEYE